MVHTKKHSAYQIVKYTIKCLLSHLLLLVSVSKRARVRAINPIKELAHPSGTGASMRS